MIARKRRVPGKFGVYYKTRRDTKNELEGAWVTDAQAANAGKSQQDILRSSFARLR